MSVSLRRQTLGPEVYEKVLDITNYQRNENQPTGAITSHLLGCLLYKIKNKKPTNGKYW